MFADVLELSGPPPLLVILGPSAGLCSGPGVKQPVDQINHLGKGCAHPPWSRMGCFPQVTYLHFNSSLPRGRTPKGLVCSVCTMRERRMERRRRRK